MPSAGLEPVLPAIKQLQTDALDRTATGIGLSIRKSTPIKHSTNFPFIILYGSDGLGLNC